MNLFTIDPLYTCVIEKGKINKVVLYALELKMYIKVNIYYNKPKVYRVYYYYSQVSDIGLTACLIIESQNKFN